MSGTGGRGVHSGVDWHDRDDCALPNGKTSRCGIVAANLGFTDAEVTRIARLANRGPKSYATYRDQLARAKADREIARANRDLHMAECPAAADRFGASA